MGRFAERRQERREERRERRNSDSDSDDDGPKTYAMKEKLLLDIGDDFKINRMHRKRGKGKTAFIANNKVMRLRETFELQTTDRETLYQIQERKMRARESMTIEDNDGHKVAEIKKKAIGVVRDNFVVKVRGDTNWQIHGSILEHEYTIKENGREIMNVHKKWIAPVQDCYFIDISEGVDEGLALCVCIALESMED